MTTPAARSRRSAILLLFGTIYLLVGLSYLGTADQIRAVPAAAQSYRAQLQVMPIDAWSWAFIGCGATALVCAARRWHTLGYSMLMAISSWWGLLFAVSWLATGYRRALIGVLLWLLLAGVLAVVVGWKDPTPAPPRVDLAALFDPDGPR